MLHLCEKAGPEREELKIGGAIVRRRWCTPVHWSALMRDNGPMNDGRLMRCLDAGTTPAESYRLLNDCTFF